MSAVATQARPWRSIGGWLHTDEAELLRTLAYEQQEKSDCDLLEIGPWKGRSTIAIASALENDHRLWTIDYFRGSPEQQERGTSKYSRRNELWIYPELLENIVRCGMQDKVIVVPLASELAAQVIHERFSFIFIDGLHTYEGVLSDWNFWSPHLEVGGVCLFHDCNRPQIKTFIDELQLQRSLEVVDRVMTTIAFRKIS